MASSQHPMPQPKIIFHNIASQLRSSPEYRLKFVLKLIFIFFFLSFLFMQCIKSAMSYAYPKWTLEFPNSWNMHEWKLRFPPMALCPGFERQEFQRGSAGVELSSSTTRNGLDAAAESVHASLIMREGRNAEASSSPSTASDYTPGTISNLKCDFVQVNYATDGEKVLKRVPIKVKESRHRIDVTDDSREFKCFDINYDLDSAPVLTYSQSGNFISCECDSSTFVKFSPYHYGSSPIANWTQWTNLRDDTATNIALQRVEVGFVSGDVSAPYYEVVSAQEELSLQSVSTKDKRTIFSVSFPQISTKRYQQYFQEDFVEMLGLIGGIGFIFTLLYKTFLWLFLFVFGTEKLRGEENYIHNYYEDEESDNSENQQNLVPSSYRKQDYEGLNDENNTEESLLRATSPKSSKSAEEDSTTGGATTTAENQDLTSEGYGALE